MAVYPSRNYAPSGAGGAPGSETLYKLKQSFFDRDAILKSMDKATRKALSKFGAFVRQRAKTSLRYRNKVSAAGSPPSAHRSAMSGIKKGNTRKKQQPTSPLREFIFFAYDAQEKAVYIGPAKTNQVFFDHNREPVTGTVPRVLEEGGQITVLEWLKGGAWSRADLRSRRRVAERPTRFRTVTIAARPYMKPAYDAEIGQLASFFANSLL